MSSVYPKVYLKDKKLAPLRRFHPWVFSGAIQKFERPLQDGELVQVCNKAGKGLATGYYQNSTIAVRVLAFEAVEINAAFWKKAIQNAFKLRQQLGFTAQAATNAYRLIHAEGDHLPGLIIDIYAQTAIIQCHSIGIHFCIEDIKEALLEVYGEYNESNLDAIYDKSKETLPKQYAATVQNKYLFQNSDNQLITENSHTFFVDWENGQKTGFFLDQRDNRQLLAALIQRNQNTKTSNTVTVLNTFCYSGGFSVYALKAGAALVHSVDISKKAIDWTNKNAALNPHEGKHEAYAQDVMKFLKETDLEYDFVVVDPPAYAKSLRTRHNAVQGYKRLNAAAFKKVKSGGIMLTFSCSQVVDRVLFYNTIVAAALESNRKVKVLYHLSQPPDHPMNIFHPEGSYLKGLVLRVDQLLGNAENINLI